MAEKNQDAKQRKDPEKKAGPGGERRDIDTFPEHRNAGEFGTHGGPKQREARDADDASEPEPD